MTKVYCEKCGKRPATFFYEENKMGKITKLQLCSHCAASLGLGEKGDDPFFSFPLFFDGGVDKKVKTCPSCGMTLSEIQRKGKFGCSACYDTFAPSLDLTPFVGKGYEGKTEEKKAKEEKKKEDPISLLKKELKEALSREEYEKAAILRDQIRAEEGKK